MFMTITDAHIKQVSLGYGKADICNTVATSLMAHGDEFKVDTPMRLKHFLGQTCIESSFFRSLEESLVYSAERLMVVWPNRFPTLQAAKPYANNPQALANYTYGNRMGNDGVNDGWRFRGSSIKQMTGRENFTAFNKWIKAYIPSAPNFVEYPDLARTLEWAVWPAFWYWTTKLCYTFADRDDVKGLTRAINGGLTGYDERVKATAVAAKVFNIKTDSPVTVNQPKQKDPLMEEMQTKLTKLAKIIPMPALDPKGIDGWNGANTQKAVVAVQQYTKLNVDGKLGPNTRKAINMLCERYGVK